MHDVYTYDVQFLHLSENVHLPELHEIRGPEVSKQRGHRWSWMILVVRHYGRDCGISTYENSRKVRIFFQKFDKFSIQLKSSSKFHIGSLQLRLEGILC